MVVRNKTVLVLLLVMAIQVVGCSVANLAVENPVEQRIASPTPTSGTGFTLAEVDQSKMYFVMRHQKPLIISLPFPETISTTISFSTGLYLGL